MRKLILIILSCLFISQFSLSAQTRMHRSPTPGFGFTSKLYKYDENSLEYQMDMTRLIRDEEERYKRVEELLKMGANPDRMAGQFEWVDTNPLWKVCRNERYVTNFRLEKAMELIIQHLPGRSGIYSA